jgi:malonyl CoA-acyl carrier protein transacylase
LVESLVKCITVNQVDWVESIKEVGRVSDNPLKIIDFGPGAGTGALNLSTRVIKDEKLDNLSLNYYSQEYVSPGPLPLSWTNWINKY